MDWNYVPELIAIAVLGILLAFHRKSALIRTRRDKLFVRCIVTAIGTTAVNIVSVITIIHANALPAWVPWFCSDLFFFVVATMVVAFGQYWLYIVYEGAPKSAYYTFCTVMGCAIAVFMAAVTVINRFTPILYSFNGQMEYVREDFNRLPFFLTVVYILCAVIALSIRWKSISSPTRQALITAPVSLIPFMIVGNFFPYVQLQGTAFMVSLLVLYLSLHSNASAYDMLTGSYNLDSFYRALLRQYPALPPRAFLLFSWQNYGVIRSEYGHQPADELTKAVAEYLKQIYGQQNVYRIAEDEFVCAMMEHVGYRNMEEAYEHLNADWLTGGMLCRLDFCVAYYEALPFRMLGQDILSYLKYGVEQAQKNGNTGIVACSEELISGYACEREIVTALKAAIKSGAFSLNIDPVIKIENDARRLFGADCGVGFQLEGFKKYPEDQIMRVAEQFNLLNPINELMLRRACAFQRQLNIMGMGDVVLFCEITQTQLLSDSIIQRILNIIEEEHADIRFIKLQLTGQSVNFGPRVRENLLQLSRRGIGVCLKDTSRSNMDDLLTSPFSYVKLNEAELFSMGLSARLNAYFRLTLKFFEQFNTVVIAGNVVSEEHVQYLESHGFSYMQGPGVMPPMQQEEFVRRLKEERRIAASS
ncbi:MAG TPA: EAL domain-containing protein [Feifaniaceae bacterium]|nr:EAL domain-containing protein [Feifaniaceae bacterium]